MELADLLGWVAVLFTLTAFSMRTMLPLRAAAIGANFCFIGFGYMEGALPILTLHAILLPCNMTRLRQIILANRELDRKIENGRQVEMASVCRLTRHESEYTDGVEVVASVDQGSNEIALGLSAARPRKNEAQEVADLRSEVAVLRKQLRQLKLDQAMLKNTATITALLVPADAQLEAAGQMLVHGQRQGQADAQESPSSRGMS